MGILYGKHTAIKQLATITWIKNVGEGVGIQLHETRKKQDRLAWHLTRWQWLVTIS